MGPAAHAAGDLLLLERVAQSAKAGQDAGAELTAALARAVANNTAVPTPHQGRSSSSAPHPSSSSSRPPTSSTASPPSTTPYTATG
ncbi:hypothetical protein [Streptomyces sp. x-80]|uniref:hypothetical protein n=1 Tax=Streptomyces sp. x-80 TaxID=2789282 RepID=UPI00398048C3